MPVGSPAVWVGSTHPAPASRPIDSSASCVKLEALLGGQQDCQLAMSACLQVGPGRGAGGLGVACVAPIATSTHKQQQTTQRKAPAGPGAPPRCRRCAEGEKGAAWGLWVGESSQHHSLTEALTQQAGSDLTLCRLSRPSLWDHLGGRLLPHRLGH